MWFYANETTNKIGQSELNVIHVTGELTATKNGEKVYECETAFFVEGMFIDFYKGLWLGELLQRSANEDEIKMFNKALTSEDKIIN